LLLTIYDGIITNKWKLNEINHIPAKTKICKTCYKLNKALHVSTNIDLKGMLYRQLNLNDVDNTDISNSELKMKWQG